MGVCTTQELGVMVCCVGGVCVCLVSSSSSSVVWLSPSEGVSSGVVSRFQGPLDLRCGTCSGRPISIGDATLLAGTAGVWACEGRCACVGHPRVSE